MAEWVDAQGEEQPPPPPPELDLALTIRSMGDPWGGGWMGWPAGMLDRVRLARNVYDAWKAYKVAEDPVKWGNDPRNASAHRIVGVVKSYRFAAEEEELTRVERWEEWQVASGEWQVEGNG